MSPQLCWGWHLNILDAYKWGSQIPQMWNLLMTRSISLGAGSIYDFYFLKQGGGHWNAWTEYITKEEETIPANAKVKEMLWFLEFSKYPFKWKNN